MNLREIHWLGVIRFMAPNAEHGGIELRGSGTGGIFGVLGLRSMTGFAGYASVAPGLFHIQDVAVASFTDFVTSVGNRLGRNFLEGITPKMAVETKALRNEDASENKEKKQPQEEESGHTKEMVNVFESNHGFIGPTKILERTFIFGANAHELQGRRHAWW